MRIDNEPMFIDQNVQRGRTRFEEGVFSAARQARDQAFGGANRRPNRFPRTAGPLPIAGGADESSADRREAESAEQDIRSDEPRRCPSPTEATHLPTAQGVSSAEAPGIDEPA